MRSHNVCTHCMYQYYVLYWAWWWLNEPKHVVEFLMLITNICCVYWLNKLLYYCKTQRDGSYQNTTGWLLSKHNGTAPIKTQRDGSYQNTTVWLLSKHNGMAPIKTQRDVSYQNTTGWLLSKHNGMAPIKTQQDGSYQNLYSFLTVWWFRRIIMVFVFLLLPPWRCSRNISMITV